jgi:hypothetical protein
MIVCFASVAYTRTLVPNLPRIKLETRNSLEPKEIAAHLRGAAGNFCIGNSVDLASRLESLAKDGKLAQTPTLGEALGKEMSQAIRK